MAKKDKQKTVWYDDNSTVSDMSEVGGIGRKSPKEKGKYGRKNTTFKEKIATYLTVVRMMIIPMIVVLAVLGLLYLLMYLAYVNASA